jgi:hypothetical protein
MRMPRLRRQVRGRVLRDVADKEGGLGGRWENADGAGRSARPSGLRACDLRQEDSVPYQVPSSQPPLFGAVEDTHVREIVPFGSRSIVNWLPLVDSVVSA